MLHWGQGSPSSGTIHISGGYKDITFITMELSREIKIKMLNWRLGNKLISIYTVQETPDQCVK